MARKDTQYIFLDEGGNFDFSKSGTRYFSITAVSMRRPFKLHTDLDTFKYDLIERRIRPRIQLESFHCAEDNSHIKKRVFEMLSMQLEPNSVDAVIVEKPKTGPALQVPEKFYPRMLGYLLKFVLSRLSTDVGEVVILTDSIPVQRKKRAIEKALKTNLKEMLPQDVPYSIMHHSSKAHYGLQIADYMNWAVFRKWEHSDPSTFEMVKDLVRSEFDIFRTGRTYYYLMK